MKVCKGNRKTCPIPSHFESTVFQLTNAKTQEEIENILNESNKECENVNCKYLMEKGKEKP